MPPVESTSSPVATAAPSVSLSLTPQASVSGQTPSSDKSLNTEYPKVLTPASTDHIEYAVQSEDGFCIYDGKKYGFMDQNGNETTPFIYDYAYPFSGGLACVCLDGKYGYINYQGDTVIPFDYDRAAPFSEGLAYFEKGDQYGFLDPNGHAAFILDCDSVSSFQEGMAYFSINGKYGYIDKMGEEVIKPVYDNAGYFINGLAKVRKGLKLGVIDKTGKAITQTNYDYIGFDSGYVITKSGGKCGCFDKNGSMVFQPIYDSITILPGRDAAIVVRGNQYEIVDFKGNVKVPAKYDSISYYNDEQNDGIISVWSVGKIGFLDMSDYSEAVAPTYDWASFFINGRAVVETDGKYGVIDKLGNTIIPLTYNNIELFNNGTLTYSQGGKYELADLDGRVICDTPYDSIEEIGDCYIVGTDHKYGILSNNGETLIAPAYDFILTDAYNKVYNSKDSCVATTNGPKDSIIVAGHYQDTDLSGLLLQNTITPRINPFNQFEKKGVVQIQIPDANNSTISISVSDSMNDCYKYLRLLDIDASGNPVLYFYAETLLRQGPGILSYSRLYSVKDGSLNELVGGYTCGGTRGGDTIEFLRDVKTSRIVVGDNDGIGGFRGNASVMTIYEYQNNQAERVVSYQRISQSVGNYDENDLIKNASQFYDKNGDPFDKGTILNADYVTEYGINDNRVSIGEYSEVADRYEIIPNFVERVNDIII